MKRQDDLPPGQSPNELKEKTSAFPKPTMAFVRNHGVDSGIEPVEIEKVSTPAALLGVQPQLEGGSQSKNKKGDSFTDMRCGEGKPVDFEWLKAARKKYPDMSPQELLRRRIDPQDIRLHNGPYYRVPVQGHDGHAKMVTIKGEKPGAKAARMAAQVGRSETSRVTRASLGYENFKDAPSQIFI